MTALLIVLGAVAGLYLTFAAAMIVALLVVCGWKGQKCPGPGVGPG